MRTNIAACTAPGSNYPEFVSINLVEGRVEITVRSAAKSDGWCGDTAVMSMTGAQFEMLARDLYSFACTRGA